jgi:hypothetical protein
MCVLILKITAFSISHVNHLLKIRQSFSGENPHEIESFEITKFFRLFFLL